MLSYVVIILIANQTPFYLTEKLPPLRGLLHLNTNPHTFRDIPCKTNRYKNSFFPNAVNSWSNIVSSFQDSIKIHITFGKLKSHMSCLFRPFPKSIFNIHDPKGLKYIFQLRMKLSTLKSHKNGITLLILLLTFASVIKALRTFVISYLNVYALHPIE